MTVAIYELFVPLYHFLISSFIPSQSRNSHKTLFFIFFIIANIFLVCPKGTRATKYYSGTDHIALFRQNAELAKLRQECSKLSKELTEKSEALQQEEQKRKSVDGKISAYEKQVSQLQVRTCKKTQYSGPSTYILSKIIYYFCSLLC